MFKNILQISFLQNRILDYLIFLSILFIGIFTIRILKSIVTIQRIFLINLI